MQNNEIVTAIIPPSARNVRQDIIAALYPMTENAGSTISDRLGLQPDIDATSYDAWDVDADYVISDNVINDGNVYTCTANHDASAVDAEPGVGAAWASYWSLFGPYEPLTRAGYWFSPSDVAPLSASTHFRLPAALWPTVQDGQAHFFQWQFFRTADSGTGQWETIFSVGEASVTNGVFQVSVIPNGKLEIAYRGIGATANSTLQFDSDDFDMTVYNGAEDGVVIGLLLHGIAFPYMAASVYVNGSYVGTASGQLNFSTNGGTAFPTIKDHFRFGARSGGSHGIGGSTSNSAARGVLTYRQVSYDLAEIAALSEQHARSVTRIPRVFLR